MGVLRVFLRYDREGCVVFSSPLQKGESGRCTGKVTDGVAATHIPQILKASGGGKEGVTDGVLREALRETRRTKEKTKEGTPMQPSRIFS
jgi:hypothetical protein